MIFRQGVIFKDIKKRKQYRNRNYRYQHKTSQRSKVLWTQEIQKLNTHTHTHTNTNKQVPFFMPYSMLLSFILVTVRPLHPIISLQSLSHPQITSPLLQPDA